MALEQKIKLAQMDPEIVSKEIGDFVIDTVLGVGSTGCVIGLSGGIDSTTTAALIKKAFDNYNALNHTNLELVGYLLPSDVNNPKDTEDGKKVAEMLGIRYEIIDISKVVDSYRNTNPEAFEKNYDKGNLMSRIRANILSTKSATENKSLAGTGNWDEDFGLGYYTLFGDGAVHMSPIGNLPKRLVRQMASYLGFESYFVNREPTAGLEPGQTDFKDLGYSYNVAEVVISGYMQGITPHKLIMHSQVKPLIEAEIVSQSDPKFRNVSEVVYDIIRRNNVSKGKARILHPPVAQVTLNYEVMGD
jgi:NAD+ synthase